MAKSGRGLKLSFVHIDYLKQRIEAEGHQFRSSNGNQMKVVDAVELLAGKGRDRHQASKWVAQQYEADLRRRWAAPATASQTASPREAAAIAAPPKLRLAPPAAPKSFYETEAWRKIRFDALRVANGCCTLCGRSFRVHRVVLHVDHIKPISIYPELKLEITNLQVLCEDCNLGKGNRDETDFRPEDHPHRKL